MTEKDILKDIRESFEASGEHLSDDFLKTADLTRSETDGVTLSGRKNHFRLTAAFASAAAVFLLIAVFRFYDSGRRNEHELMLPDFMTEKTELPYQNDSDRITLNDGNYTGIEYTVPYGSSVVSDNDFSYTVSENGQLTVKTDSIAITENCGQERISGRSESGNASRHTDITVTAAAEGTEANAGTRSYTAPFTENVSTEPWWYIETVPYTAPFTENVSTTPWWNIDTYPCTTEAEPVTEPLWNIGTYPCTSKAELVTNVQTKNSGTAESYTELPVETTAGWLNFRITLNSEWDENEEPLIFEDDRFICRVDHPGKYILVFDDGYTCSLEYAVRNGLVTTMQLMDSDLPISDVTFKN